MGDFRASVKIEFHMADKTTTNEWWINWSPDDTGVDPRIIEWLADRGAEGVADIRDAIDEGERAQKARDKEVAERAEYERLKSKFEAKP